MADYNTIREALGAAIQSFQPGLNVYDSMLRTIVPPAAIITPVQAKTTDNLQAMGASSLAKWSFNVMLIVGRIDERAAQQQVGALISPGSPLITALNNTKLANGFAHVTQCGTSSTSFDQGVYTYAHLQVMVLS